MGIEVDFRSLGLGFGAGVLTTLAIQRAWRALQQFREDDEGALQGRVTAGGRLSHRRYSRELLERCQVRHTYGDAVPLSALLVEPRFIPPMTVKQLEPDADDINIYAKIPMSHDHPYLYAPYNMPTLRIRDLGKGENTVAILGRRGSGRTTALHAIALYSLGQVDFAVSDDNITAMQNEELAQMKPNERKEYLKERRRLSQLTLERLAEREGLTSKDLSTFEKKGSTALEERSPLLIDVFNLNLEAFRQRAVDPAEPLVRALQVGTKQLTRRTMARTMYRLLNTGQAIVLIDHLDYLPEDKHQLALQWLKAFVERYNKNLIFVTYDIERYHPLTQLGFASLFLRAWHDQNIGDAAQRVVDHWKTITRDSNRIPEEQITALQARGRAHTPFELLMRMRGVFNNIEADLGTYTADYIAQKVGRDDNWQAILGRLGRLQLQKGTIQVDDLVALDSYQPFLSPTSSEKSRSSARDEKNQETRLRKLQREQQQLLNYLEKAGLLIAVRRGYRFLHHELASYCASLSLDNEFGVEAIATEPIWYEAIGFAAAHLSVERAVAIYLQQPSDFTHRYLTQLARWLAYAGEGARWRGQYLRQMGNLILAPNQYQVTKERLIASLISTRDKGATVILQRAFQSNDKALKQVAALALGAIENKSAVSPLTEQLADPDMQHQIVMALALSAIRDDDALEVIGDVLQVSPNEYVRRAVAEALANDRETGYLTLYDAVKAEEMLLRRSAIFGLGRIETDWAQVAINDAYQREDEEYYVQSAAEVVFINQLRKEKEGVYAHPQLGAVPWLMEWGAEQVSAGRLTEDIEAIRLLEYALQQRDDNEIQLKAARTAGLIGIAESVKALYGGLFDRQGEIRNEVYRALIGLEMQLGRRFPTPNWVG